MWGAGGCRKPTETAARTEQSELRDHSRTERHSPPSSSEPTPYPSSGGNADDRSPRSKINWGGATRHAPDLYTSYESDGRAKKTLPPLAFRIALCSCLAAVRVR